MAQLLTPPPSPRMARRQFRESNDASGFMSIEEYLYRIDPYRSTTISNPLPYPLHFRTAYPPQRSKILSHRQEIETILHLHGLSSEFVFSLVEVTKPQYPEGDNAILVARIGIYEVEVPPGSLGPAKDEVNKLLNIENTYNIDVEIVHELFHFQPSLFPISPEHQAVQAYNAMHDRIIEMLHGLLNHNWNLLCLFEAGNSIDKTSTTIIVMVSQKIKQHWMTLVNSIKRFFNANFRDLMIEVEILPGCLSTLTGGNRSDLIDISNGLMESMQADGRPLMGTSIGVRGEQGGGTLGGLVTLNWNGVDYQCAITNYHVVKPAHDAEDNIKVQADRYGSCPWRIDDTNCEIIYYSPNDVATLQNALIEAVQYNQQNLDRMLANYNRRVEAKVEVPETLRTTIEYLNKDILDKKTKLRTTHSMPRVLGRVFCSSGAAIWEGRINDWAFILLSDDSSQHFEPNRMPFIPISQNPSAYKCGRLSVPEGTVLDSFGTIKPGEWYFRLGRSSAHAGVSNGVAATCNWDGEDRNSSDEKGNLVLISRGVTKENIILNRRTANGGKVIQGDFGLRGDSGSLLVDKDGKICGLCYGKATSLVGPNGEEEWQPSAGLAMTIPEVVKGLNHRMAVYNELGLPANPPVTLSLPTQ